MATSDHVTVMGQTLRQARYVIITECILSWTLVSTGPLTAFPYFITTCQITVLRLCNFP